MSFASTSLSTSPSSYRIPYFWLFLSLEIIIPGKYVFFFFHLYLMNKYKKRRNKRTTYRALTISPHLNVTLKTCFVVIISPFYFS